MNGSKEQSYPYLLTIQSRGSITTFWILNVCYLSFIETL